ncbi:hypothetical protein NJ7G_2681 [Natrinema sp. J7-2]|nr:hypothetical protein NJ7G_2681 [Natrinema sp. J7-2]
MDERYEQTVETTNEFVIAGKFGFLTADGPFKLEKADRCRSVW